MTWTKDRPSQSGYYGLRNYRRGNGTTLNIEPVIVRVYGDGSLMFIGSGGVYHVSDFEGEWCLIELPE